MQDIDHRCVRVRHRGDAILTTMTPIWTPPTDFSGWIKHVFGRPISQPEWFWAGTQESGWEPAGDKYLTYLADAFEHPESNLAPFSDAQLGQGLSYLINPSVSNAVHAFKDETIAWNIRRRAVRSIHPLFERLLSKRCSATLSHLDENGSPLNSVCYMWWDVFPVFGQPGNAVQAELDREILDVMGRTLSIDQVACQESALHGLSHWVRHYPAEVGRVIEDFLSRRPRLRSELKQYALDARAGRVQ